MAMLTHATRLESRTAPHHRTRHPKFQMRMNQTLTRIHVRNPKAITEAAAGARVAARWCVVERGRVVAIRARAEACCADLAVLRHARAVPRHALQCCSAQSLTRRRRAAPRRATAEAEAHPAAPSNTAPCSATQHRAAPRRTTPCSAVPTSSRAASSRTASSRTAPCRTKPCAAPPGMSRATPCQASRAR